MLMYGKEASNRKQEIDSQHYTIPVSYTHLRLTSFSQSLQTNLRITRDGTEKERAETQLAQEKHKLERLENRKKYLASVP